MSASEEWNVKIVESGRSGSIEYRDIADRMSFYWEFGGGDTVAIIWVGDLASWSSTYRWAIDHRQTILEPVAHEVLGTKLRSADRREMRKVDTFISVNLPANPGSQSIPFMSNFVSTKLMRQALRSTLGMMIFATALLSSGCEKERVDPTSQSTPGSTKPLEAASLVGYDGKKLRKSVDGIKEANQKHNQELEKAVGSGPDQ